KKVRHSYRDFLKSRMRLPDFPESFARAWKISGKERGVGQRCPVLERDLEGVGVTSSGDRSGRPVFLRCGRRGMPGFFGGRGHPPHLFPEFSEIDPLFF